MKVPITVTVEAPCADFEEDPWELVSIEGSRETPNDGVLSPVDWFEEEISALGLEALVWGDDVPKKVGQRLRLTGYLCSTGIYYSGPDFEPNCDVWFEIEKTETLTTTEIEP